MTDLSPSAVVGAALWVVVAATIAVQTVRFRSQGASQLVVALSALSVGYALGVAALWFYEVDPRARPVPVALLVVLGLAILAGGLQVYRTRDEQF